MNDFNDVEMVIEIPKGSQVKYEVDHETGKLKVDRLLFTPMNYPAHYGYIEDTLGEDGDPLDIMVLLDQYVVPGAAIDVRPVAVFNMVDDGGPDAKILAVPADPRWDNISDIDDISKYKLDEIQHFFEHYKDLEPGKFVETADWGGKDAAQKEIKAAFEREEKNKGSKKS